MIDSKIDISIIIPTYNCEALLENTLRSVFEQKECSYECVVVDGLSKDLTLAVAQSYRAKYADRVVIISEKDQGIYDAMNKGIRKAKGRYIVFMGAGDTFCSDSVLSKIKGYDADIVYGYVQAYDEKQVYVMRRKMNFFTAFRYRPICHQAVFARREVLQEYPFELKYKYVADQAWILRMYAQHKKFKYINLMVAFYGLNGFSSTEEGRKQAMLEIQDAQKRYFPRRSFMIGVVKKLVNRK